MALADLPIQRFQVILTSPLVVGILTPEGNLRYSPRLLVRLCGYLIALHGGAQLVPIDAAMVLIASWDRSAKENACIGTATWLYDRLSLALTLGLLISRRRLCISNHQAQSHTSSGSSV